MILQPTLQRQLGVTVYGGSCAINLLKQKVEAYHKKQYFCYRDTTQQSILS